MSVNIDFVITWVDGDDKDWQKSKNSYLTAGCEDSPNLYRDWDNLQYWFRGVEKFAPWVSRIHFVTCGHLPKWLNRDHGKLNIVKHSDFIPPQYLPTFSSHAIELNLHRIEGLTQQFVYFNDDTFAIKPVRPEDFFKNHLPCASAVMTALMPVVPEDPFFHYLINNLAIINKYFTKRKVLRSHFGKWFSLKYGKYLLNNIYYAPLRSFSGFANFHLPASFLISTCKEVWEKEFAILDATCKNKFRTINDVNQYVFSYWQYASGQFSPRPVSSGRLFVMGDNDQELFEAMSGNEYKMICINDSVYETDFIRKREAVKKRFDQLLPDKSGFEL